MLTVAAVSCAMLVTTAQQPAGSKPPDFSRTTNAELIKLVPVAGTELQPATPEDGWREHPAATELRRRILERELSDADWKAALISSKAIHSRTEWPSSKPFAIGMVCPTWLGMSGSIEVRARLKGSQPVRTFATWGGCAFGNDSTREQQRYQETGELPTDTSEVLFDVTVEATSSMTDISYGRKHVQWRGTVSIPVRPVAGEDGSLLGVPDPNIHALLRKALTAHIGLSQGEQPTRHMWVGFEPSRVGGAIDHSIAFPIRVDVMDGSKLLGHVGLFDFEWRPESGCVYCGVAEVLTSKMLQDKVFLDRLTLRVSADRNRAFQDLSRSKYWKGEFVVPLRECLDQRGFELDAPAAAARRDRTSEPPQH